MSEQATSRPMSPTAIAVADAARLLSAAGGYSVTPEQIQADIDAGAPTNADGTINLVQYAAWLVLDMSRLAERDRSPCDRGEAAAICQGPVKEMSDRGD